MDQSIPHTCDSAPFHLAILLPKIIGNMFHRFSDDFKAARTCSFQRLIAQKRLFIKILVWLSK